MTATPDPDPDLPALVNDIAGPRPSVDIISAGSATADGAAIALVRERTASHIVQISPVGYPHVVAAACERARAFAAAVGPVLAAAIVLPASEGENEGRSFASFPFHAPFGDARWIWWLRRRHIASALLRWLEGIARLRRPVAEAGDHYRLALDALRAVPGIDPDIGSAAAAAIGKLDAGIVMPCHIPMHGDLWRGNVLRPSPGSTLPFAVIDWGGSQVDGYPIFDVVRVALSYRLPPARLRRALHRHARLLGCSEDATEVHLLAALGHYARHLGEMPLPAFLDMSRACFDLFRRARN